MNILFFRHGESTDDIDNQYGGWADFELTAAGKENIEKRIALIIDLKITFQKIYSSPLKRALQTAGILSTKLSLDVEVCEFLKERNTYGILSGMNKDEAKKKYPDLVRKSDKKEYVYGSERKADMISRVQKTIEILETTQYSSIIAVTHGNFMRFLMKELCEKEINKVGDGGFILTDISNGKINILTTDLIEFA